MFYFPIIILLLLSGYNRSKDNRFLLLVFFITFLFSALRYDIGYDYRNYILRIHGMPYFDQLPLAREFFSYLLFWISHILENPQIFFSVNSFITLFLIFYTTYKYSNDIPKSIWVFLTFPMFFLNSLSIVRNFTAFSIIFFSQKYIFEKKPYHFLLCIVLAGLFHNSAFFALPIYFLNDFKLTKKRVVISILAIYLSVPVAKAMTSIFIPSYSGYFVVNETLKAGRPTLLILAILLIISLLNYRKLLNLNNKNKFYLNNLFFGVVIFATYHKFGHFSFRMTEYLYIYIILLIPDLFNIVANNFSIYFFKQDKNKFLLVIFTFVFYLGFYLMYIYMIKVGGKSYYPYSWKIFRFFDPSYYLPFVN